LPLWASMVVTIWLLPPNNECQLSINNFGSCIMDTQCSVHHCWPIINAAAASMGQNATDHVTTTSWKWASTERQPFLVMHLEYSKGYWTMLSHDPLISCLYRQKCYWRNRICHLQLSAHRASTISIGAQLATKIRNASHCYWIQCYVVSLFDKCLYSTSQISMQCLTDLIFSHVVVESIFKNPRSAVLYHYLRQSFESHYQAF